MAKFIVTIAAESSELGLLMAAVANFRLLSVEPEVVRVPKNQRYLGGRRDKGISGDALLMKILESGIKSRDEIGAEFMAHGFALTSASPILSKAVQKGLIKQIAEGRYVRCDQKKIKLG